MFELMLRYEMKDIWYDILPFDNRSDHLRQLRHKLAASEGRNLTTALNCALEYAGALHYYLNHKHLYR